MTTSEHMYGLFQSIDLFWVITFAAFVLTLVMYIMLRRKLNEQIDLTYEAERETRRIEDSLEAEKVRVRQLTGENNQLKDRLTNLSELYTQALTNTTVLEEKLKLYTKTTKRLLKEVADDVTVNVNNDGNATVIQKPKRKYTRRKPRKNARSTTDKSTI